MSTEIYYFSGTGNSLHVAKELQKRIPETELIPLVSLINKGVIKTKGETVGFVFPIRFMTVPVIVKSTIKKLDLTSSKYIFAIVTRCGTPCSTAFTKIENMLKKRGKHIDSYIILNMASNDPKFSNWHPATKEEIAEFEAVIQNRLNMMQDIIINRAIYQEKDAHIIYPVNYFMEQLGSFLADTSLNRRENFFIDSKCSGCGICEKVCLSQRIKMIDEKPVWQNNVECYFCYACINYCPEQSIQISSNRFLKSYTDINGRYHHPESTVNDIAGQKCLPTCS
ncbi:MAG: EFR1 family ferrodoxin [Thermacetogeniaceae bacterium]